MKATLCAFGPKVAMGVGVGLAIATATGSLAVGLAIGFAVAMSFRSMRCVRTPARSGAAPGSD